MTKRRDSNTASKRGVLLRARSCSRPRLIAARSRGRPATARRPRPRLDHRLHRLGSRSRAGGSHNTNKGATKCTRSTRSSWATVRRRRARPDRLAGRNARRAPTGPLGARARRLRGRARRGPASDANVARLRRDLTAIPRAFGGTGPSDADRSRGVMTAGPAIVGPTSLGAPWSVARPGTDREPFITADGSVDPRARRHPGRQRRQPVARRGDRPARRRDHRAPPPRSEEIYLFTSGAGRMRLGDEETDVRAGDASSSRPAPRTSSQPGGEPLVLLCCCSPPYSHEDTVLLEG